MNAAQLDAWFRKAAPGERLRYYRGNLGWARADIHAPGARQLRELADAARLLGTPQHYEVHIDSSASHAPKPGQGLAHLAQRRIEADVYEYFITKSAKPVLT